MPITIKKIFKYPGRFPFYGPEILKKNLKFSTTYEITKKEVEFNLNLHTTLYFQICIILLNTATL